jgi:hypothetical protein
VEVTIMTVDATFGDVTKGYRRVLIMAAIFGMVGLVVSLAVGHYIAGVTLCVGIALGFINARLTLSAAARYSETQDSSKRPIIFGSLKRLGAITVVALLLAYALRPDGLATLAGLALFQILLLGKTSTSLLRELRRTKA